MLSFAAGCKSDHQDLVPGTSTATLARAGSSGSSPWYIGCTHVLRQVPVLRQAQDLGVQSRTTIASLDAWDLLVHLEAVNFASLQGWAEIKFVHALPCKVPTYDFSFNFGPKSQNKTKSWAPVPRGTLPLRARRQRDWRQRLKIDSSAASPSLADHFCWRCCSDNTS